MDPFGDIPPLVEETPSLNIPKLVSIEKLPKDFLKQSNWELLPQRWDPPVTSIPVTSTPKSEPKTEAKKNDVYDDLPPLIDDDEVIPPKTVPAKKVEKASEKSIYDGLPPLIDEDDMGPPPKKSPPKPQPKVVEEELPPLISDEDDEDEDNDEDCADEDDLPELVPGDDEEEVNIAKKPVVYPQPNQKESKPQSSKKTYDDIPPLVSSDDDDEEEDDDDGPPPLIESDDELQPLASSDSSDCDEEVPELVQSDEEEKPKSKPIPKKPVPKQAPPKRAILNEVKKEKPKKKPQAKKKTNGDSKKFAKIQPEAPKKEEVVEKPKPVLNVVANCKIKCTKESDSIVEKEEYYKVSCSESCNLNFHKPCWLKLQREHKDEEFYPCATPDCQGTVCRIERVHKANDSDQMVSTIQEYAVPRKKREEVSPEKKKVEPKKVEVKKEVKKEVKEDKKKQPESKKEDVKPQATPTVVVPQKDEIKVHINSGIKVETHSSAFDTQKILEDLKKKKEAEHQKWSTDTPKKQPEKKEKDVKKKETVIIDNILAQTLEEEYYSKPSGSIDTFWDETEGNEEKSTSFPKIFEFPSLPGSKGETNIWAPTEEDLKEDGDDLFLGEVIFMIESGNEGSYGLVSARNGTDDIFTFNIPEGNQTGKKLKVGDAVKFMTQNSSEYCILVKQC